MKVVCWFLQWHLCIQWIPWSNDTTKHHQRDPVTATRARAWRKWPISRSQWPHYALRGPHDRCMLIRKHTKFCTRCTNTRSLLESSIYFVHMLCEFGMLDISYTEGHLWTALFQNWINSFQAAIYIPVDRAICKVVSLQNEENSSEIYRYKWSKPFLKEKNFIWWGRARCFSELFCSFLWWQPNFLIFSSGQCKYCYIICSIISTPHE